MKVVRRWQISETNPDSILLCDDCADYMREDGYEMWLLSTCDDGTLCEECEDGDGTEVFE